MAKRWRILPSIRRAKIATTTPADIERVHIGDVVLYFRRDAFIGFEAAGERYRVAAPDASFLGTLFVPINSYRELVQKLYVALAQETATLVSKWVDEDLMER